MKNKNK